MADNFATLSIDLFREQREEQENLRLRVANELQHEPDRARRVLSVSAVTGLPGEVVDAQLENLEKAAVRKDFDLEKWRDESPDWASFASENPYHLAVLQEDQENMGQWERSMNAINFGWDSTKATVELGLLRSKQMSQGGVLNEKQKERLTELQKFQVAHEFGAPNWFAKFIVKNAKMAGPTIYSLEKGLEGMMAGAVTFAGTTAAAGLAIPFPEEAITVPAAWVTGMGVGFKVGAGMASFELERGFAYDEYLEMGLDHETAMIAANAVGGVNAALEVVSLGAMARHMPGLSAVQGSIANKLVGDVLVKPSMRRATGIAVARFGETLGIEVVTEVLQESVTAVTGEFIRPENLGEPLTWQRYTDRITDVALETLQGAFIMSSFGPTASYLGDTRRAIRAQRMEAVYKALGEASAESTTRKKVPSKYREWVERQTKDGPIKSLLIDVERFTEYFQDIGQDPDKVAKELGIDLTEAKATGVDVEIPIATYAEKIAPTEHHDGLLPDLKSHEDEMSAREALQWRENADELQKVLADQAAPEGHAPIAEIHETMMGELLAAGVEHSAAEKYATFQEYVFATLAERNNMDPVVLFKRYWGGVRQEIPGVLQKTDVDVFVDPLLDRLRTGDVPTQRDIFGESLTDFLKAKGGLADIGGELAARDVQKEIKGLVKATGISIDAAAEVAAEAGFIAEADEAQLLDALDRELRGQPVFGRGADEQIADLAKALDDLGAFLEAEGIDLEIMTNAEIRKRLEGDRTLDQSEIDELLDLAIMAAAHDDTLLTRALMLLPDVTETQDFGELTFADTVAVEGLQEDVVIEQYAQRVFDKAMRRRNDLQALLDCVSG